MTPRTRALYEAYLAAAAADETAGHHGGTDNNADHNDHSPQGDDTDDHWTASNVTRRIELSDFRDDQGDST